MGQRFVYSWPGGLKSVAGGTRTKINLSRPWQKSISEVRAASPECSICNDLSYFVEIHDFRTTRWYLRYNRSTPYNRFHRLIVPHDCWSADKLSRLGGVEQIQSALIIATKQISKNPRLPLFITVHVGALGGQTVIHPHYHVVKYLLRRRRKYTTKDKLLEFYRRRPDLVLVDTAQLLVGVGGIRAGQCFILPHVRPSIFAIAERLDHLIILYKRKFRSLEGLPPEFNITLFYFKGVFQYGVYTPTLNHWGGSEQVALLENDHLALPWPHEVTVKHLKS